MPTVSKSCPKCQGQMVQGFLFDNGMVFSSTVSLWFEGEPEKAVLGRTKTPPADKSLPTAAFRCSTCGYLEFYAGPEYSPK